MNRRDVRIISDIIADIFTENDLSGRSLANRLIQDLKLEGNSDIGFGIFLANLNYIRRRFINAKTYAANHGNVLPTSVASVIEDEEIFEDIVSNMTDSMKQSELDEWMTCSVWGDVDFSDSRWVSAVRQAEQDCRRSLSWAIIGVAEETENG